MKESDGFFKFLLILVVGYFLYRLRMMPLNRSLSPIVVKYDPYLDRVDGVYGRASSDGSPMPYPNLTGPGPRVPYGSPEWII